MISQRTADACFVYAYQECYARDLERDLGEDHVLVKALRSALRTIYQMHSESTPEAREYLDMVKKVFEIDTAITDVRTVLLRAAVLGEDASC